MYNEIKRLGKKSYTKRNLANSSFGDEKLKRILKKNEKKFKSCSFMAPLNFEKILKFVLPKLHIVHRGSPLV